MSSVSSDKQYEGQKMKVFVEGDFIYFYIKNSHSNLKQQTQYTCHRKARRRGLFQSVTKLSNNLQLY